MTMLALLLDDPWLPALYALGLTAFWLDARWHRAPPPVIRRRAASR